MFDNLVIFPVIFFVLIIVSMISIIVYNKKRIGNNRKPIKEFRIGSKKYLLYSIRTSSYYTNHISYELKDEEGTFYGAFNSLNDVLVFLNIDEFPSNDIFS